ncbi:hypothetical protein U1Q18_005742 [Sarracenia purpurea var. burkii]
MVTEMGDQRRYIYLLYFAARSLKNPRSHLLQSEPFSNSCLPGFNSSRMKIIAAYLLAVLGGNVRPSADDLKDILGAVGAEADEERIELLLSEVKGKDITELIAAGREKLASVPAGGGGGVALAAVAGGGGGGAAAPAEVPKKEEKVEEKEESDDDMGFSLFD